MAASLFISHNIDKPFKTDRIFLKEWPTSKNIAHRNNFSFILTTVSSKGNGFHLSQSRPHFATCELAKDTTSSIKNNSNENC